MVTGGTRAIDELRRAGIAHAIHEYALPERHGPARDERPQYGLEAAVALGIPTAQVCKTLVAVADGTIVLAVVPSDASLDLKRLAAAIGAHRADLADPRAAERATGYVIGGISPIGTRRRLRTVVDARAAGLPTVHVSAGRRGLQLSLAPVDLVRATAALVAPIATVGDPDL
jgi:Cys-tRNA(Pro)/Cys-tRNA(Cys) deacylase